MKGSQKVVETLQFLLKGELAARDQYFTHSRMYDDWGLSKLFERLNHEMEEETDHADQIIKRLLFLEATPDLSVQDGLNIGVDVKSCIENYLQLEYKVVGDLKASIALCERLCHTRYAESATRRYRRRSYVLARKAIRSYGENWY